MTLQLLHVFVDALLTFALHTCTNVLVAAKYDLFCFRTPSWHLSSIICHALLPPSVVKRNHTQFMIREPRLFVHKNMWSCDLVHKERGKKRNSYLAPWKSGFLLRLLRSLYNLDYSRFGRAELKWIEGERKSAVYAASPPLLISNDGWGGRLPAHPHNWFPLFKGPCDLSFSLSPPVAKSFAESFSSKRKDQENRICRGPHFCDA